MRVSVGSTLKPCGICPVHCRLPGLLLWAPGDKRICNASVRGTLKSADMSPWGLLQAAVDMMRKVLNTVNMDGVIVIGEGEKDEVRGTLGLHLHDSLPWGHHQQWGHDQGTGSMRERSSCRRPMAMSAGKLHQLRSGAELPLLQAGLAQGGALSPPGLASAPYGSSAYRGWCLRAALEYLDSCAPEPKQGSTL